MNKRGKYVDITTPDTDTNVLEVPKNRYADILEIQIRNSTASVARVRLWDQYTVDATAKSVQKADYDVAAGDTIAIDTKEAKHIIGKLVAQSSVAGVQLYVGVVLK